MIPKIKVLVLGSNSFQGSDFIDLLLEKNGYDVVGVSRSAEKTGLFLPYKRHKNPVFKFVRADLNHDLAKIEHLIDDFRPDHVVNFAAQSEVGPSWDNPDHWFLTNAVAITRLANMLKNKKWLKRYVHISSPEVYGTCHGTITEEAPLVPSTPYAASKAAGDMSLFTFYKNCGLPLVMVRSTNVYGAHQQLFKIIPRAVIYIKQGRVIPLHGGGKAQKSFIHVRDISCGELALMEQGEPGQIYHLSPDQAVSIRDVVSLICKSMNVDFSKATEAVAERLGQDAIYKIDSTKARAAFGWRPTVDLNTGITGVISWVNDNWTALLQEPLDYVHKA